MAMTISVAIPSSPDAANTPPSTDGAQTPVSPSAVQTLALPPPADSTPAAPTKDAAPGQAKRKPSRRANTAERRATHNAVERQRRETLNSRFLDLAALLPNLSQIRRPSKSSIVNSSIAHIQASRRHRMIAARELRLLKLEADALRRELNEWRDRSGLPRVEEPVRGEAFQMILSGEVEVVSAGPIEEEGDNDDYGEGFPEDDYNHHPLMPGNDSEMAAASLLAKGGPDVTPFAHNVPSNAPHGGLNIQTMLPRQPHGAPSPMIVHSPTAVSFENPAMASMYEPHAMHAGPNAPFWNGNPMMHRPGNEDNKWGNIYAAHHGQHHHLQGPQQFTPPTSSHGHGGNSSSPPLNAQAAYLMNLQQQQQQQQQGGMPPIPRPHAGHMFGSPVDGDDASSVGSAPSNGGAVRRERSGSMNSVGAGSVSSSNGGSPPRGSFELSSSPAGGVPVPRRMNSGMGWDEGMGGMNVGGMGGMGPMGMNMNGMGGIMKSGAQSISVGGGGNGHGFAAMMM